MATRLDADLHVAPHVIGALLNHDPKAYKGITAVYTRADDIDAKRSAMDAWASLLARIIDGTDAENVVALQCPD